MKQVIFVLMMSVVSTFAFAEDEFQGQRPKGPPAMNLSAEDQACLAKNGLGKPGEGERPTREAVEAAFSACEIEMPKPPGNGHRRHSSEDDGTSTEQ